VGRKILDQPPRLTLKIIGKGGKQEMAYLRNPIAMLCCFIFATSAQAFEFGSPGWEQKPGLALGASAGVPPPGLYMFDQTLTYQSKIVGPGAPDVGGKSTTMNADAAALGLLYVPGWTFLGATYDAVLVQPYLNDSFGSPLNLQQSGLHNTYIVPGELSWRLGDSGFFVKAGLGIYAPDGTMTGVNKLDNIGNPWWTFQPEIILSYLKDGWNITANVFQEINTASTVTGYRSGDILHAEFAATKTIGKWTFGPVAYYVGQVTDDKSSAFYGYTINTNRYNVWAAGALVGYDFGPVALNVWALDEFSANASGGTAGFPGTDSAIRTKGYSVFASLSYRLWAPEGSTPQAAKRPQFNK
jgi:hypothetical protein